MKIRLSLLLILFSGCAFVSGCASGEFSVTLFRSGGASSITERYSVDQDGVGTKMVKIPLDSESKQWTYSVDPKLFAEIRGLMTDSVIALSKINMLDDTGTVPIGTIAPTGELMSGITIDAGKMHHEIRWANVDPPRMSTPAFDSLYSIMLGVEARMISP